MSCHCFIIPLCLDILVDEEFVHRFRRTSSKAVGHLPPNSQILTVRLVAEDLGLAFAVPEQMWLVQLNIDLSVEAGD